jgi:hypothetical protein
LQRFTDEKTAAEGCCFSSIRELPLRRIAIFSLWNDTLLIGNKQDARFLCANKKFARKGEKEETSSDIYI